MNQCKLYNPLTYAGYRCEREEGHRGNCWCYSVETPRHAWGTGLVWHRLDEPLSPPFREPCRANMMREGIGFVCGMPEGHPGLHCDINEQGGMGMRWGLMTAAEIREKYKTAPECSESRENT